MAKVYRNDDGTFVDVGSADDALDLPPSDGPNGVAVWGDYDNDGDLEILLTGFVDSNTQITKIYRNDDCAPIP
ncbi:MAG: FG-GAP-like repeat-containing protein [Caldilineaceae bacterium]